MKIKNCLIIAFGKCAIEMEKGDKMPEGNAIQHIDAMSKDEVKVLKKLFPKMFKFIEARLKGKDATNLLQTDEGYSLIRF